MKLVSHERNSVEETQESWETPDCIFQLINDVYHFDVDVAATKANKKCERFIGPDHDEPSFRDALVKPWYQVGTRAWCNPPYSLWAEFVALALENRRYGMTTVVLIPPRLDTVAFHEFMPRADEMILPKGRFQFEINGKRPTRINAKTGKEEVTRNGAASGVFVFAPRLKCASYGHPRIVFWDFKLAIQAAQSVL